MKIEKYTISVSDWSIRLLGILFILLLDKPEVYKDAPVGLQVVGQRLEEEAVLGEHWLLKTCGHILTMSFLAMMEEVDDALKRYKASLR